MTGDRNTDQQHGRFSLRRWAQRKLEAGRSEATPVTPAVPAVPQSPTRSVPPAPAEVASVLPPIESLTIDSDFTLFMQPNVDAMVRRAALKQLFRDPRFNVMDGLDTYIDDYTRSDPIPEGLVKQLAHARAIFDPPPTMLTPEGHVVDAPAAAPLAATQASACSASDPAAPTQCSPDAPKGAPEGSAEEP